MFYYDYRIVNTYWQLIQQIPSKSFGAVNAHTYIHMYIQWVIVAKNRADADSSFLVGIYSEIQSYSPDSLLMPVVPIWIDLLYCKKLK